jgi:hypothetical protein
MLLSRAPDHSARYKAHLRSPEWAAIREEALIRSGYRCQLCGLPLEKLRRLRRRLEVHHNNYANLGHEQPEDLVVLCAGGTGACHAVADAQRRSHSHSRARSRSRRRGRRRGRSRRRRSLGVLRLPVYLVVLAGLLKITALVLPAVT